MTERDLQNLPTLQRRRMNRHDAAVREYSFLLDAHRDDQNRILQIKSTSTQDVVLSDKSP